MIRIEKNDFVYIFNIVMIQFRYKLFWRAEISFESICDEHNMYWCTAKISRFPTFKFLIKKKYSAFGTTAFMIVKCKYNCIFRKVYIYYICTEPNHLSKLQSTEYSLHLGIE